jgi:hypothetical protein
LYQPSGSGSKLEVPTGSESTLNSSSKKAMIIPW